jgi:hypothetical protein
MLFLAKELGKTLEEILDISTLEFTLWAAYYQLQGKQDKQRMRAK